MVEVVEALVGGAAEAGFEGALGDDEAAIDKDVNLIEEALALGFGAEFFEGPAGVAHDVEAEAMAPAGKVIEG